MPSLSDLRTCSTYPFFVLLFLFHCPFPRELISDPFETTMPPIPPLFTLPVAPNGRIICTQPSPRIYLLSFESPPDNRLTPSFCASLLLALDILDHKYPKGVVITTSLIPKFYSNGLDYESAVRSKTFFSDSLYPLWRRFLTYVPSCSPRIESAG